MKKLLIVIVPLILMSCNNQNKKENFLRLEKQKNLIDSLNKTIDSLEAISAYSTILKLNFNPSETKLIYGEEYSSNAIYEFLQSYGMGYEDYIFYTRTTTHDASPIFLSSVSYSNSDFSYWIKDDKENVIEEYEMEDSLFKDLSANNREKLNDIRLKAKNKAFELAKKNMKKYE